jgi:hypothetical protein
MAIIKNDYWSGDYSITTDPSYGAVPPLTVTQLEALTVSAGGTGNTIPNVTISDGTGLGGYTIGGLNGATGANAIWTTTGTGTGTFSITPNYSAIGTVIDGGGRMSLKGDKADLDINGKSLTAWMERVEERLNILTPNPELEKEWDELRRLGERYRKLEKKCKEKAEVWNKLKAMPKPEVKW